jgi:hypothetical protein
MQTMKNILVQHSRSLAAKFFLAVIVAGPVCVIGGAILQFTGTNLAGLVATVLHLV